MDAKTKTWRDEIKVHPAADLFPMMSESELRELGKDIKRNGLRMPIYMWAPDKNSHDYELVDGRNRLAAMELVGIRVLGKDGFNDKQARSAQILWYYGEQLDPWEFVVSANIHRRHLTQEQKRDLVAKLLKATPEKSNRQIAATIGVDHKTVGAVRQEREARGEIPHVVTITDTKGRQQPRKVKLVVSTENITVQRMQQPQSLPLQLTGTPISSVNRCVMRHREFVFELARAVPAETWTGLVSALQGDLADIAAVLERQRKEQGSEADAGAAEPDPEAFCGRDR
ncbi:ParB N-terminal domain-containing protein [Rhizobium laguerreae]|uniref:ParB N-terminal domain-containing protein n=1 Tax=Rhizobium laguerreae TaxID=1076926 RepID=UPI0014781521|nr:ParB N-terminal domain-containing protein [Rhizobium laguerreae]NNH45503.1 ParB N-terminal domain-containing protein [Rhizobium laguerreae]